MKKMLYFLIVMVVFITSCIIPIKHRRFSFLKSFSPDVTYYKLYMSKVPNRVTYKSKSYIIKEGLNCKLDELTSRISIDLANLCDKSGEYYIGISSVNNLKEESKIEVSEITVILE